MTRIYDFAIDETERREALFALLDRRHALRLEKENYGYIDEAQAVEAAEALRAIERMIVLLDNTQPIDLDDMERRSKQ